MKKINIRYEWKPPRCNKCKGFGHVNYDDKKAEETMDEDGFKKLNPRRYMKRKNMR